MSRLTAKREVEIRESLKLKTALRKMNGGRAGRGSYETDVRILLHEIDHLRQERPKR